MSSDTLSEVLRAVRLTGAVFLRIEGSAPWVAEAPDADRIAPHIMPGSDRVIEYHVVTRGCCFGGLLDQPAIELAEGDVIVFPQGDPHVMASAPGLRGQPAVELHRDSELGSLPLSISLGTSGPVQTEVICGFLGCDDKPFNPLLATLPRLIHVPARPDVDGHLSQLVRVAVAESRARRAGGECMLARLSELLFIEVVRRYVETLPDNTTGWLAGLRDEFVGRALACLHDRPARDWSLDDLAREVGLSRSMIAERFHHFVGLPPMQYLTRWRMQLAASLLSGSTAGLNEIAERVGYGSEAALSHAFKRWAGVAPSSWRAGQRLRRGEIAE